MEIEQGSDQRNKDFSGTDFSGMNLRGVDFSGSNLSGANFWGAQLAGTDFINSNLTGAKFSNARFEGGVHHLYSSGYSANFNGADLNGCDLSGANVNSANFVNTNFGEALIQGASFDVCGFDAGDLSLVSELQGHGNLATSIILSEHFQDFNASLDEVDGTLDVSFTVNQPFYDYYQTFLDNYYTPDDELTLQFRTVDGLMPLTEKIQIQIPVDNETIPFDFSQTISLPTYLSGREIQLSQVSLAYGIRSAEIPTNTESPHPYFVDDGFGQELAGFDLYPDSERDIPSLEITQITSLALSDTEFSNLVANGQYEDVYGVVVEGSYTDASNLANAILHLKPAII